MITYSVVLYNNSKTDIDRFLSCIDFNQRDEKQRCEVIFVDNSEVGINLDYPLSSRINYVKSDSNLGFGNGHNLAFSLRSKESNFFVICNLDIVFNSSDVIKSLAYLSGDVLLVSPRFVGSGANIPRVIPFPGSVLMRKIGIFFGIRSLREKIEKNYLYGDSNRYIEVASGAFMLMKSKTFLDLGGFDSRMWMFIEDWDLSYRIWKMGKILYLPSLIVIHSYSTKGRKNMKLIGSFARNLILFKFKHQFPFDRNRSRIKQMCSHDIISS